MIKQIFKHLNLALLLCLVNGFLTISLALDKEKTFNVSRGDKLEISATHGNVNINIWAKDQAYIKAINLDEADLNDIKIEQLSNKIMVEFNGKDSDDFSLEISMPAYLNADVSSGAGNITINGNINGNVELNTGGGNIITNDVGDKLDISTGGGNITVGIVTGVTEIGTGGGNIIIKELKSKSEVSTAGGNISIGNIGGNAEVSSAGGNISVGKVSGSVELSTAGGNINLDGAIGIVEANTAGGNITLKNISGSIDANTAGGNIYAELSPAEKSKSDLNTASGDINLIIPVNTKVNILASVNTSKNLNKSLADQLIKSDFEVTTEEFFKGNLVKKFVLNGGGPLIELNTASGKIKINKK